MPIRIDGTGYIGTANNIYTDASGNVGVGTNSPSYKLHVAGQIFAGREDTANEGGQVSFGRASDNAQQYYIDCYGSSTTPSLRFIDATAAAVRMQIDSSGRVTRAYQTAFRAYINSSADTTYTLNTILPFNATAFNVGSNYNTSTYLFTAPVAGYYYFHSAVYGTSSGGAATMSIRWYINGSLQSIPTTSDVNIGTGAGQVSIAPIQHSVIFSLAANDTVGSYCTAYNGTVFRIFTGASIFEGYLLG